ncbi:ferrochelatase [Campylobacterota bacterium]|nr:ferrochelatase [Campylobacterota bacterium]
MQDSAVVLLNMGGASSLGEVPLFLNNMFRDKRILPIAFAPLRYALAKWITIRRSALSQSHYRLIGGRSPLLGHTRSLAAKLQKQLDMPVVIAMRYTPPFSAEAVREIKALGVKRLAIIPLYPQYSTTTTLSSLTCFYEALQEAKCHQEHFAQEHFAIERFYDHPTYNSCVIEAVKEALGREKADEYALIFSAHSLPQSVIDRGDPYQAECKAHAAILTKLLTLENLSFASVHLAYQSKLGSMKWLEPPLESALGEVAASGCKKALIVPISFTIDNLETDYELSIDYRKRAKKLGLEVAIARCPNDSDLFVTALGQLAIALLTIGEKQAVKTAIQ